MASLQPAPGVETPLHVIATAGHVDHGKSSLIVRLTGIDPDRWAEEKRRGLTIDLGFAWCSLPSGREVGFVDVPGHERFVRNMLAGVGPVRLVLFVVAADEGWKPQSEEHLAIVDVLGAEGGVVALTKRDLVDAEGLLRREHEVRERIAGTTLADAPIVACSAQTGEGLEDIRVALDAMVAAAPAAGDGGRPRLAIDRSFTIRGAGTVVTGTLTGGELAIGDEVRVYPEGGLLRVRSLQTHRRVVTVARPVSRVAVNLAGIPKDAIQRGDVLARAGQWRPASVIEGRLRAVRGLGHPLTARGAYKLYVGSAERDAVLRLYGTREVSADGRAFARIRLSRPVVVEPGDRFVLREAGRRETVAGGVVLDADPLARAGADAEARLARRERASREHLPAVLVEERAAVRADDVPMMTGAAPAEVPGAVRIGDWWVAQRPFGRLRDTALEALAAHHAQHPLRPGMDRAELLRALEAAGERDIGPPLERGLGAELLASLERGGVIVREGNTVRLATHRVTLGEREEEARRLVETVASGEPTPPTIRELRERGFGRDLIDAAVRTGRLLAVSHDVVLTPEFARRAEELARREAAAAGGLTVSRFRELLGTTRKYALPILESFDRRRITRRQGDVRRPGGG